MDEKQKFDINLMEIVPEYYNKNKLIRDIFLTRLKVAIDYCKLIKTKNILDAGCGDGLFLQNLHNNMIVKEMTGIDMNEYVDELNRNNTYATFLKRDINNMLFCDKCFDTVTCLDVLEHFENLTNPVNEIKRVLKKNGHLIVSGPVESFWYKLGRFVIKGKFSKETGPGAGKHYHNIKEIDNMLQNEFNFSLIEKRKIKILFFHLFSVNLYRIKK